MAVVSSCRETCG